MAIPANLSEGQASEKTRSLVVRGMLIFGIIVDLGSLLVYNSYVGLLEALKQEVATQEQVDSSDAVATILALIQLVVYIATIISWLMWQYRAYTNLKIVGSGATDYTPAWSVGYWFAPFLNLWRPFQVTSELWRRSKISNASMSITGSASPLIVFWWICWLVSGALSSFASRGSDSDALDALRAVAQLMMISQGINILTAVLAIVMITKISQMQQAMRTAEPTYVPPPPSIPPTYNPYG